MTPQPNSPSPDAPRIHPDDMATYLEVMESKHATEAQLEIAHRVAKALENPAVRKEWEAVLQIEDPMLHPERYPSAN